MAVRLQQTRKATNMVEFLVSGITTNRSTYVWCTYAGSNGAWLNIADAKSQGFIRSYDAQFGDNGLVTVYPYDTNELKVWQFSVDDVDDNGAIISTSDTLSTVLAFEYDNASTKNTGNKIDITVNDLQQINLFGLYIKSWILDDYTTEYYPLEDVSSGYSIFADYLVLPAQNIYDTAKSIGVRYFGDLDYSKIINNTQTIINNVYSGAPFKAEYFNGIREAINCFKLSA